MQISHRLGLWQRCREIYPTKSGPCQPFHGRQSITTRVHYKGLVWPKGYYRIRLCRSLYVDILAH